MEPVAGTPTSVADAPIAPGTSDQARRQAPRDKRRYLGLAALAALLVSLTQSSAAAPVSPAISANALLLAPGDFPTLGLRETQRLGEHETRDGGQAAQIALDDGRMVIYQSVVVFPTADAARASFQAARQAGEDPPWRAATGAPVLGAESMTLVRPGVERPALTTYFRIDRVLVRLTVIGTDDLAMLARLAGVAQEKVPRARSAIGRQGGIRGEASA